MLTKFVKNQSGATAIEYGLIIALVAAIAMGALRTMGQTFAQKTNEVRQTMSLDPTDRPKDSGDIAVPSNRTGN